MIAFDIKVTGITDIQKALGAYSDESRRALNTAIRVKGYNMMRELQRQIRSGAPGGRRFAPLSFIARIWMHRGRNEPLKALSQAVKYAVPRKDPIEFRFGFVGPVNRREMRDQGARGSQLISKSWLRIAAAQQAGIEQPFDRVIRRGVRTIAAAFARQGAAMREGKRLRYSHSRFFFLRKSTRRLRTPARPIIDPFWMQQRSKVTEDIRKNFRRKLAGERI